MSASSRYAVVRRPDADTVDAVVVRADALSEATLDSAFSMLRIVRMLEPAPGDFKSVTMELPAPPSELAAARAALAALRAAPFRTVPRVGRGQTIDVKGLDERPDIMIRRAP